MLKCVKNENIIKNIKKKLNDKIHKIYYILKMT